jgi:hypothetical protein
MREPVNKNEQNRIIAVERGAGMPAFRLSRKTFYKWQARRRAHGEMSFAEWGKRASPQQVGKLDCCRTH